jgi:hypothetical protein
VLLAYLVPSFRRLHGDAFGAAAVHAWLPPSCCSSSSPSIAAYSSSWSSPRPDARSPPSTVRVGVASRPRGPCGHRLFGAGAINSSAPQSSTLSSIAPAHLVCGLWYRQGTQLHNWRCRGPTIADLGTARVLNCTTGVAAGRRLRTLVPPGYSTAQLALPRAVVCGLCYRQGTQLHNWRCRGPTIADFGTARVLNCTTGVAAGCRLRTLVPPGYSTAQLALPRAVDCGLCYRQGTQLHNWRCRGPDDCGLWYRQGTQLHNWRCRGLSIADFGTPGGASGRQVQLHNWRRLPRAVDCGLWSTPWRVEAAGSTPRRPRGGRPDAAAPPRRQARRRGASGCPVRGRPVPDAERAPGTKGRGKLHAGRAGRCRGRAPWRRGVPAVAHPARTGDVELQRVRAAVAIRKRIGADDVLAVGGQHDLDE